MNNEYHGNSVGMFVVLVVVLIVPDSWDSFFGRFAGTLSLSLWLTQAKPLGSHYSSSSRRPTLNWMLE